MYNLAMDVAVSALRSDLASWLDRVRAGEEVVVTDRGVPVARLVPVDAAPLLERLMREGVLSKPLHPERPKAADVRRVSAQGSVADLVGEQRR